MPHSASNKTNWPESWENNYMHASRSKNCPSKISWRYQACCWILWWALSCLTLRKIKSRALHCAVSVAMFLVWTESSAPWQSHQLCWELFHCNRWITGIWKSKTKISLTYYILKYAILLCQKLLLVYCAGNIGRFPVYFILNVLIPKTFVSFFATCVTDLYGRQCMGLVFTKKDEKWICSVSWESS